MGISYVDLNGNFHFINVKNIIDLTISDVADTKTHNIMKQVTWANAHTGEEYASLISEDEANEIRRKLWSFYPY